MANCVVCGVPREKHGTYPTCATHAFRDCCSATPSEPYRKDCWDAGQCLSVQWILVHQIEWDNAPPTYEVRRVGRGFMPCPFCGGRDTAALAQMPLRKGWLTVQCARCEASGPWRTEELAAVAAWNSRAEDRLGVTLPLKEQR